MNYCLKISLLFLFALSLFSGCQQPVSNQGPRQTLFDFSRPGLFGGQQVASNNGRPVQIQTRTPQEYQAYANLSSQLNDLNQRVGAFDADNQQLHTEIAGLTQKLQLANQYNQQLKQQLADNASNFQRLQFEKSTAEQQLAASQVQLKQLNEQAGPQSSQFAKQQQQFQNQQREQFAQFRGNNAPTSLAGAATVRANNSLLGRINDIQIPGGQARMDGDVIRIEFPSDQLFSPGTYQIAPAQAPLFQNLVTTIRQSFPRQIIGVEAHWDNTPLSPPGTTDHQLTATQSLAIFNHLVKLGLPADQLFTMAMGSNRPRHAQGIRGGISPNRRVEIVIYPEMYDAR